MKRLTLMAMALMIFTVGCGAYKQSLMEIQDMGKVAVIAISTNIEITKPEVKMSKLAQAQASLKAASALAKGESVMGALAASVHTLDNVAAAAPYTILENMKAANTFNLMPQEEVLANQVYQSVEMPKLLLGIPNRKNAAGWKSSSDFYNTTIAPVAADLGVEAVMTIDVECAWVMKTGVGSTGSARGSVTVTATLYKPDGSPHWTGRRIARSDESVGIVAGVYDWEKMDVLLIDATNKASKALFDGLAKSIAKL